MKKKQMFSQILFILLGLGCGVLAGIVIGKTANLNDAADDGFLLFMLRYVGSLLLIALAFPVQIICHEGGHLLFGLLSGYRFSSFRVGSLMITKDAAGKLVRKKLSLAGTGGQCLMAPPYTERDENGMPVYPGDDYPCVLYNLGGVLMNLILAVLFFLVWLIIRNIPAVRFLSIFSLGMIIIGVYQALSNGIPIATPQIQNDGANIRTLLQSPTAKRAFWIQMQANSVSHEGIRLSEMPEDWFTMPAEEDMGDALTASIAFFRENRLIDAGAYDEAADLIEELLQNTACAIPGIYRNMLVMDKATLLLIKDADADVLFLEEKQQKAFMAQMKNFPSTLRTEYLLALSDGQFSKAKKIRDHFEKIAESYPNPVELVAERTLMDAGKASIIPSASAPA